MWFISMVPKVKMAGSEDIGNLHFKRTYFYLETEMETEDGKETQRLMLVNQGMHAIAQLPTCLPLPLMHIPTMNPELCSGMAQSCFSPEACSFA